MILITSSFAYFVCRFIQCFVSNPPYIRERVFRLFCQCTNKLNNKRKTIQLHKSFYNRNCWGDGIIRQFFFPFGSAISFWLNCKLNANQSKSKGGRTTFVPTAYFISKIILEFSKIKFFFSPFQSGNQPMIVSKNKINM